VPGLTGLWQDSGKNRTTFSEMVHLDIEYSERASLKLDVKIILKTLPALWEQFQDLRARKRQQAAAPSGARISKSIEMYCI
jgi:exopolysaccharide production protein ExoY